MDELIDDPFADDLLEGDCGCGGNASAAASESLPSAAELQLVLNSSPTDELAEADLLAELHPTGSCDDDPFSDLAAGSADTGLQDLLELAQQNPGLKITLSF